MTGTEQPRPAPVGDASQTGWIGSPTLVAYGVAAFAALIAFETPVAVVTSCESESMPGGAPGAALAVLAPIVGGAVGGMLVRRWATRPGEL